MPDLHDHLVTGLAAGPHTAGPAVWEILPDDIAPGPGTDWSATGTEAALQMLACLRQVVEARAGHLTITPATVMRPIELHLHDQLGDVAGDAVFGLYLAALADQGPRVGVKVTVPDRLRYLIEDVTQ